MRERFSLPALEGRLRFPKHELPLPDAWPGIAAADLPAPPAAQ